VMYACAVSDVLQSMEWSVNCWLESGVFRLMHLGKGNVQLCNAPTSNRVSANLDDTLYKKLWILYSRSSHFKIITKASMKSEN
jgi:hypothetical protein